MDSLINKNFDSHFDVLILGAGLSGTLAALELPPHLKIALVEMGDELIHERSTSHNQCNKLHLGLHHAGDLESAQKCLEDSMLFANKYKAYILGQPSDPWRRGRYFAMSNSLSSAEEIQDLSLALASRYKTEARKCNYVFGKPENFMRVIKPELYPEIAKELSYINENGQEENIHVALGIESSESQIDIKAFRQDLEKRIHASENIAFIPHHKVNKISFDPTNLSYSVSVENIKTTEKVTLYGESVVNCTWHNIETLDRHIKAQVVDDRLIRIKASLLIKLPSALHYLNSCLFSVGPFCSFTNLGDGTAIISEERISNIGHYPAGAQLDDSKIEVLIKSADPLAEPLGKEIAANILFESARFIPKLAEASILALRTGYLKIHAHGLKPSLYSPESSLHFRTEGGVEQKGLGYFSASGMKMTYTFPNALMIKGLLDEHFRVKKALNLALEKMRGFNLRKYSRVDNKTIPELGFSYEAMIKGYVSAKTGISLTRLNQVLLDDQLALILREYISGEENHPIVCRPPPVAAHYSEHDVL